MFFRRSILNGLFSWNENHQSSSSNPSTFLWCSDFLLVPSDLKHDYHFYFAYHYHHAKPKWNIITVVNWNNILPKSDNYYKPKWAKTFETLWWMDINLEEGKKSVGKLWRSDFGDLWRILPRSITSVSSQSVLSLMNQHSTGWSFGGIV